MNLDSKLYTYHSKKSNNYILIADGLILLLVAFFTGSSSKEFYFSYLTSYFFWLSILLGGIFFTLVHHGFSATWSTVIRRIMENTIVLIPIFTVFNRLQNWSFSLVFLFSIELKLNRSSIKEFIRFD